HGYVPAVLVLTRVVSRPHSRIVTCDAGHKALSADAGVPVPRTGRERWRPQCRVNQHLLRLMTTGRMRFRPGSRDRDKRLRYSILFRTARLLSASVNSRRSLEFAIGNPRKR